MTYTYALTQNLDWQHHVDWQNPDTPFMLPAYWQALTNTNAIGEDVGWLPIYVLIYASGDNDSNSVKDNRSKSDNIKKDVNNESLQAVMPVFVKNHHQGEYVFDHAWAEAYARYGVDYYPRLVTCVPYTPVTGQRVWLAQNVILNDSLVQTLLGAVNELSIQTSASSWHGLFMTESLVNSVLRVSQSESESRSDDAIMAQILERQGNNFLWQNQQLSNGCKPFTDFEEFLGTLTAKKRKNIRAERKKIAKQQLSCRIKTGDEIGVEDWNVFYQCYAMTYLVRGRRPYLSAEFFQQIGQTMAEHLLLAQGLNEHGEIVASSLFFYDGPTQPDATLYGRYWGALEEYDSLHFELCYYQGIEFAIAQGLSYFDPGTQGEHKLIRGFVPTKTHSIHQIFDARFEPAIAHFCEQDRKYMQQYRQDAHDALPFNIDNMPMFKG